MFLIQNETFFDLSFCLSDIESVIALLESDSELLVDSICSLLDGRNTFFQNDLIYVSTMATLLNSL